MRIRHFATGSLCAIALATLVFAQDHGAKLVIGNVALQDITPGIPQAGHAQITGTFRAGQVFVQKSSPAVVPVVGNNTAVGIGSAIGGSFSSGQQSGIGVRGTATSAIGQASGVKGESRSAAGFGVFGANTSSSGAGIGVYGESASPNGYAGYFNGRVRMIKLGVGADPGESAVSIAGEPTLTTDSLFLLRRGGTTGFSFNGAAQVTEAVGLNQRAGLVIYSKSLNASASVGVDGNALGTGLNVAIWGHASGGSSDFAGRFNGDVAVVGTLSKSGGSFKIDHPLDPANKYLSHSFVESPDMMNVYNGETKTDGRGYATVTMPDWFEALNRDFRYQLTVIDDGDSDAFVQAKIVRRMRDNRFTLRTSAPNVTVSWQVTGIRHDKWANANRIPVEERKAAEFRGYYLNPKEFGQTEESGIDHRMRNGASQTKRP